MILDRFKELNVSEVDLEKNANIFDDIYNEYINNTNNYDKTNDNTKRNVSGYIYRNHITKMKTLMNNKIIKNLKKNNYAITPNNKNNIYGFHKEINNKKETYKNREVKQNEYNKKRIDTREIDTREIDARGTDTRKNKQISYNYF
jgi:alpha-galactosidase/6-phospho-beta-glucosidase family protein